MSFQVGFELVTDNAGFLVGVREAQQTMDKLSTQTKSFEKESKQAFTKATNEVEKFNTDIKEGIKSTTKMSEEVTKLGNTQNAVKQLKQEIKFYTSEAYKAGQGTKAFADNLAKAGQLKDELGDLNSAVNALNGNIGENLSRAAGQSIGLVSRGFEGVIALEVLAGVKSKEFEQTLLKLQSLNAISRIAQEFGGLKDKITEIKLGVQGLFNLIKANPITALITGLVALGGGIVYIFNKVKELGETEEKQLNRLISKTDEYLAQIKRRFDVEAALSNDSRTADIEADKTEEIKATLLEREAAFKRLKQINGELDEEQLEASKKNSQELEDLYANETIAFAKKNKEQFRLSQEISNNNKNLKIASIKDDQERELAQALKRRDDAVNQLREKASYFFQGSKLEAFVLQKSKAQNEFYEKEVLDIKKKFADERSKKYKEEADKRKALEKDLADFIKRIAEQAQQAELEGLNPQEKIARIQQNNLKDLSELRSLLIEKGKLTNKNYQVSQEQEEQFAAIRLAINQRAANDLLALEIDSLNKRAEAKLQSVTKTQQNLALAEQNAISGVGLMDKPVGVSDADFELIKQQKVLEIQRSFVSEKLKLQQDELAARRASQITGFDNELKLLADKNDDESNTKRKQIINNINLIEEGFALEGDKIQLESANQINSIEKQIQDVRNRLNNAPPIKNIFELLGIPPDLAQAIQVVGKEFKTLTDSIIDAQERVLNSQLNSVQRQIDLREENISDLESKLEEELSLNEEGYANNSDAIRAQIEVENQLKEEALIREAEIIEKKKNLAKIQLAVDTVSQGANMVTAATNIYKGLTLVDPTGIAATVAVGAMLTAFAIQKAAAYNAIENEETPGFKDGVIDLKGPGTSTSDSIPARLSKGESVMTAKETQENYSLFKGIRSNDKDLMYTGIMDLIKDKGIILTPDIPNGLIQQRDSIKQAENNTIVIDSRSSDKHLISMNDKFQELLKVQKNKVYTDQKGNLIIQTASHKQVIRKK